MNAVRDIKPGFFPDKFSQPRLAAVVFPGMETEAAVEKLWKLIFEVCRIDADSTPWPSGRSTPPA